MEKDNVNCQLLVEENINEALRNASFSVLTEISLTNLNHLINKDVIDSKAKFINKR